MSLWEAQMLHSKGRLSLDRPFAAWLRAAAAPGVVALLPLDVDVMLALDQLPPELPRRPCRPIDRGDSAYPWLAPRHPRLWRC
jgi:PIN domain nuclease of toxin-antitoxin system